MSDPKVIERVRRLISLAVGASAEEEEARTAAVLACKLVAKHGLIFSIPSAEPKSPAPPTRIVIANKWPTVCWRCERALDEGEKVAWAQGKGVWCLDCSERAP